MRSLFITAATAALALTSTVVSADVGVLDRYQCHNHQQTGQYHCHGPADLAKLGGFVAGVDGRVQAWSVDGGETYLFAGIAANAEYNYRWVAVTGSYFIMPMVTGVDADDVTFDDSVMQQGWEIGAKVGPGVGRKGSKVYLTAGWSNSDLTDKGNSANDATLSGYYAGVGFGANTATLAVDAVATYRDPASVTDFLEGQGTTGDVLVFDTRVSVGWRF
ncbi:hypothetical protein [Reinekea blandensis]|uniref:Outer membrane protein beta-barrel domain-containing protein n=1 Tax=Reinekea blandensis MED297 TaxID=314283 RepID=A4BDA4_9GAMM|nr:hypothetical protein [Reinekea blandensis]EAR09848.1 hypothetical protein MED297_05849 [Reinekea sp. MED297] [Reinekea blandensis MED297]